MRGQADFGMYAVKEVSASISDMGEVAARLGSIDIYDKRGDVISFDNFEEPLLKWASTHGVAGSVVILSSTSAKSGSQSIKLVSAAGAGNAAAISKKISILGTERLGVEISFANVDTAVEFHIDLTYYTGVVYYSASLLIDLNSRKLYVYDEDGNPVEVATFSLFQSGLFIYYTVKLVIDFKAETYVRLLLGHKEYDISAVSLETAPNLTAPYFFVQIGIWNRGVPGGTMYIDDYINTQAEP